jgi:hypothetical protein
VPYACTAGTCRSQGLKAAPSAPFDIGCRDLRRTIPEKPIDEIRHRGELVVAVAAGERRHEGVLHRQRRVRAGEQDRHQIGRVGVVDGAVAELVGVGRLHALAVPIAAIGAIAGEDLDAEARTRSRFLLGSLPAPVLHFAAIESPAGIVVEWERVSMSL